MEDDLNIYKTNDKTYNEIKDIIANDLKNRINKFIDLYKYEKIIILCIGSTRINFDSFGPIIGSKLNKFIDNPNISIYGTIEEPINAINVKHFLSEKYKEIEENLTIAIDASIADIDFLGHIFISNRSISPGKGFGKNLPYIGNMSIRGITCDPKSKETLEKQKIYFDNIDINPMTNIVAEALILALDKIFENKENSDSCKKLVKIVKQ